MRPLTLAGNANAHFFHNPHKRAINCSQPCDSLAAPPPLLCFVQRKNRRETSRVPTGVHRGCRIVVSGKAWNPLTPDDSPTAPETHWMNAARRKKEGRKGCMPCRISTHSGASKSTRLARLMSAAAAAPRRRRVLPIQGCATTKRRGSTSQGGSTVSGRMACS